MENRVSEEIAERRALPSDPRPLSLGSGGVPVCRGNLSFLKAPRLAGRGSATGRDLPRRTDCPGACDQLINAALAALVRCPPMYSQYEESPGRAGASSSL
jgi:hypothetical protein